MTAFFYICDYLRITPSQFFDDSISYPAQVQEILEGLTLDDKIRGAAIDADK